MARHDAHLPVVATRSVAEDSRQSAHRPRARVPDVVGRVDVTEEHEPGWDLGDSLPKSAAAHQLHLVVVIVCRVEDPVGWTMGDEDVEALRDGVPDPVDGAAVPHVGPVTVARGEWGAPDSESTDAHFLVDEEVDPTVLDEVTGDEALLEGGVVVARDEDLVGDREGGEPVDEGAELRLVAVWVLPVRGVPGVDDGVDAIWDDKLIVVHVSVRDVPDLHS